MDKQIIISISREYGSAGHEIAVKLGEKLNLPVYDRNLLDEIANTKNVDSNDYAKYDEKPRKLFLSRTVRGHSNSPEKNVAELQFALLKSKAADDDSFIIVGRCGDDLFQDYDGLATIFICGDWEDKIQRIQNIRKMDAKTAKLALQRHDKKRAMYHDYFSKSGKWGVPSSYDICVNSSVLGIDGTVDLLFDYIKKRFGL